MKKAELFKKENGKIRCLACAHKCLISEGKVGICGVRQNKKGILYSLVYGRVAAENVDPIEKKPLYRFLQGSKTYSIGTVGCNMRCDWCQNADISQASKKGIIFGEKRTPKQIVDNAIKNNCKSIAYTYNEPIIFIEYIRDIAKLAKKKGLKNILVTNGFWSKESFDFLKDYIDAVNIDLKTFNNESYQKFCGARLKPVLDTIKRIHKKGIHLEITTLIIPGINDSAKELVQIIKFISKIDRDIPWHISRFFPMYKMLDKKITPIDTLERAYKIGKKHLNHVYVGNV